MKRGCKIYSISQLVSAVVMILALVWLTVSTPFVYAAQQELAKQKTEKAASPLTANEEESSNPFGNSSEEKAPGNTSLSEEFIHNNYRVYFFFSVTTQYHKCENADTYTAFHGELLVPPPNAA
jgi:cytoskeletal protein RodZ